MNVHPNQLSRAVIGTATEVQRALRSRSTGVRLSALSGSCACGP